MRGGGRRRMKEEGRREEGEESKAVLGCTDWSRIIRPFGAQRFFRAWRPQPEGLRSGRKEGGGRRRLTGASRCEVRRAGGPRAGLRRASHCGGRVRPARSPGARPGAAPPLPHPPTSPGGVLRDCVIFGTPPRPRLTPHISRRQNRGGGINSLLTTETKRKEEEEEERGFSHTKR